MSWAAEPDKELLSLRRCKLTLEAALANEQSEVIKWKLQLDEERAAHSNDIRIRQEEEARAVKAEEALRKKIEECKLAQVQRANSVQALAACEDKLTEAKQDIKRLNYDVELAASRPSNVKAPGTARLAEEKAALERKVKQLSADLRQSEASLARVQATATPAGGNSRLVASSNNNKLIALENQIPVLQAENAGLRAKTTSSSRTSISPADLSQSQSQPRNRFGFGSSTSRSTDASVRPSSALANHSQLPLSSSRRRSSTVSIPGLSQPSTSAQPSPRVVQLERDLADARSRAETIEKEMGEEKTKLATKLAAKEAKLTQVENQLMALEREKKDESEEMKNLLEEVQQDVEKERRDVVQMKAEMRGETEQTLKGLREEKTSLAAKVGRMEVELEKREAELERCEMRREEVEMKLAQAKDDEKTANAKVAKNLTDLPDDMAALDRDLTKTQGDLKREGIARERTEELLSQARIELDNVQAASTKTLEALRSEKASLQRDLEETKAALHVAADKLNAECDKPTAPSGDDEETASLKLEVVDIQSQLSAAQATIAELESRDIVLGDVARADIARLETRIAELEMELQAAAEEGSRHVAAAEAALAEVSSLAERAAAAEQESEQIQSVVAECDAELLQAKSDLETFRSDATTFVAERAVLQSSLTTLVAQLATKDVEITSLSEQLASVDVAQSAETSALASSHAAELSDLAVAHLTALDAAETAHSKIAENLAQLVIERDTMATTVQSSQARLASFDATTAALGDTKVALANALAEKEAAEKQSTEQYDEMVLLEQALVAEEAASVSLQTRLADLEARPACSHFDEVESLRTALDETKASADGLSKRVSELESFESEASEGRAQAEEKVAQLTATLAEVRTAMQELADASADSAHDVQQQLTASQNALADAESRISVLEQQLASSIAERDEIEQRRQELEAQGGDLELSLHHLETVENDLRATLAEVEALRATNEQSANTAQGETTDLRRRLIAAEMAHEETSSSLSVAEARVRLLEPLVSRADASEQTVDRLQSALDASRLRLQEADDHVAQLEAELDEMSSASSPLLSPSSPRPSLSDDSSRQAVLVARLREERDDLRSRLDFSQNEARFRNDASVERVRNVEDAKSHALSTLQVRLLEKTTLLEEATSARASAEASLQHARGSLDSLAGELETAQASLADAVAQGVENQTALAGLADLTSLYDALLGTVVELEKALQVERETLTSTHDALDEAVAASNDLQTTVEELEADLQGALLDATTSRQAAEQATSALTRSAERVRDLEVALEAAEDRESTASSTSERVPRLQAEVEELSARILRRNAQIGSQAEKIALLESRLAVTSALRGNDGDETVEAIDADLSQESDLSEIPALRAELAASVARLAEEVQARESLEERLKVTSQDLKEAREQLVATEEASTQLRTDLAAAKEAATGLELALDAVRSTLKEVESRYDDLQAHLADVSAQYEDLSTQQPTLTSEHDALQSSHAALRQRHTGLQAEHDSLQQTSEALQRSVAEAEDNMTHLSQASNTKDEELAQALSKLASLEAAWLDERASQSQSSGVILARLGDLMADLAESEKRVASLTAELEDARRAQSESDADLTIVQQALAAAEEALGTSGDEQDSLRRQVAQLEEGAQAAADRVVQLVFALEEKAAQNSELDALYHQANNALADSTRSVADLESRLASTTREVEEAQQAAESSTSALQKLQAQLHAEDHARSALEATIADLTSQVDTGSADFAQVTSALTESRALVSSLQEKLEVAQTDLIEYLEAIDANAQAIEALEGQLAESQEVREELVALRGQLADAQEAGRSAQDLSEKLEESQRMVSQLQRTIELNASAAARAKSAAVDAASREIRTLKQLGRSAATEAEQYKAAAEELKGTCTTLDRIAREAEGQVEALRMENDRLVNETQTSKGNVSELLDHLEKAERKNDLLEAANEDLRNSLAAVAEAEERVKELETMLEGKALEMEETDEKYIEVLRCEKRHLGQIERLKERLAVLQRDLTSAKVAAANLAAAAPPPAAAPHAPTSVPSPPLARVAAPVAPNSAGKKRTREPEPAVSYPPRAVVATVSRAAPMPSPKPRVEKENDAGASALVQAAKNRSPTKRKAPTSDSFVPLKPEHLVIEKRDPLSAKNSAKPMDNLAALRAKMNKLKDRAPERAGPPGAGAAQI